MTELSWPSCRQLLYQAVATILAHAGFECANESVLETLTDVAHEYCLKFTKLLRFAVDREALLGQSPFPDVMEQVFHEVGIGSVLSLQKFWQHRIKDYHTYMLQVRWPGRRGHRCHSLGVSTASTAQVPSGAQCMGTCSRVALTHFSHGLLFLWPHTGPVRCQGPFSQWTAQRYLGSQHCA